jgi:hypothetical protein
MAEGEGSMGVTEEGVKGRRAISDSALCFFVWPAVEDDGACLAPQRTIPAREDGSGSGLPRRHEGEDTLEHVVGKGG